MKDLRKSILPTLLLSLISAFANANQYVSKDELSAVNDEVITLRRHFHQYPELSNREYKTAEYIANYLRDLGLEVTTGVAHNGVVGILKGRAPGPVVALRADMDALPVTEKTGLPYASKQTTTLFNGTEVGVMHACGHDAHMAILLGVAKILSEKTDSFSGAIKFIFQPAEEGLPPGEDGGARMMVKEGVFDKPYAPDAIFGLHVWPFPPGKVYYRSGGAMAAVDTFYLDVKGVQTHGSAPWGGVDPIYAAAQIATAIQGIPSRRLDITKSPSVITVGTIQGGVRPNIISDKVSMTGTIRTFDTEVRQSLLEKLRETVTLTAASSGAEAELNVVSATPVTFNAPSLVNTMLPILTTELGENKLETAPIIMAGEDFSYYQQEIPGFFVMLGTGADNQPLYANAPNHSPEFLVNEKALITGVEALSTLALGFLENNAK